MHQRASGILLHPTSLPGGWGIGDLGPAAYAFLDWLASAGQSLWQILPLGPTGFGDSPYTATSSFAGNPLLISPDVLAAEGFLPENDPLEAWSDPAGPVDYGRVAARKDDLLRRSWEHVLEQRRSDLLPQIEAFTQARQERPWLADWALFEALDREHGRQGWLRWPESLRRRDTDALAAANERLEDEIRFQTYVQFLFSQQWRSVRRRAHEVGVEILGDLPIYVAPNSCDVWANQHLFDLGDDGAPRAVAGVPPDDFTTTGQLWGNPLYRWDRLRGEGFSWWVARIAAVLRRVDHLRLDHFRGFAGFWSVPAAAETAAEGEWLDAPGAELFAAVERALGKLPLIAEDLGVITPDVVELRQRFEMPGMKVLQFGFGEVDGDHLPHHHTPDAVAYTGTHDNDTTRGWFAHLSDDEKRRVLDYLGAPGEDVSWSLIRAAMTSVARWAVIPLQDVLELESEARMNTPGEASGNWTWRYDPGLLSPEVAARLRRLTVLGGRFSES